MRLTQYSMTNTKLNCPFACLFYRKAELQGNFDLELTAKPHPTTMKKILTSLFSVLQLLCLFLTVNISAQDVGIGTLTPDYKLHISDNTSNLLKLENTTTLNTGVMSELFFKTGLHYTGALKTIGNGTVTARLGFFTYAATNSTALLERMSILDGGNVGIGTNNPGFLLDVNGRMRVRNGGGTAGIHFMDAANAVNRGFVGLEDDNTIGFYGGNGAGWGLTMDITSGTVSIPAQLYVTDVGSYTASFNNNSGQQSYTAVEASAAAVAGMGIGINAEGGGTGVYAIANMGGSGHRYGVEARGQNGTGNNYGVYASASGGNVTYGVYSTASGGNTNWAGYFSGSLYSTGTYQGSDRKLKNDILPLRNAISLIKALKPSTYTYKTAEFNQMELPEGTQFGLIADEVKTVFPSMVRQVVQPAMYENDDTRSGKILSDEVSFEAVNYTAMIPVLIAAMQEQQAMIEAQQKRIAELEARIK